MKSNSFNRLLATTALAAVLSLPVTAHALPVLFGGASADGVSTGNIEPGQTVTATTLLQLQAPDGSIITIEPGSVFTLTGEGDSISFELVSGAIRVASSGMPISVSRGGVSVTTTGGAFSAYGNENGGLDGRVNQGTATVRNGSGEREFARGEGYEASETSIAGTFTPPAPGTSQFAQNDPGNDMDYSPADQQGSNGASIVEDAAGGGGGYGGIPPVTGVVVPLEGNEDAGYSVIYAADSIGIDGRAAARVTVGAGGELNQYDLEPDYEERLERNSNQSLERSSLNDNVFIERWAGGETRGNYYNVFNGDTIATLGRTSHQGFHIVYGKPTDQANLPTGGVATYDLVSATAPTMDNGRFAPGTFDGVLGILFGPIFKVGIDFTIDMPGDHVYSILTAGGAANPSAVLGYNDLANGMFRVNGIPVAQGGAACPTANCDAVVYGLFTGAAGEDVGIVYHIMDFTADFDDLFRGTQISGAAIFSQASYDPGDPAPPSSSGEVDAPLGAGPYTVSFNAGILGGNSDVTLDGDGALEYFDNDQTGPDGPDRGTAQVADLWGNEEITIGRWNDGTTSGFLGGALSGVQGYHYAVGTPLTNLPVYGIATYTLAGATAPTFSDGGGMPGTFTGAMGIAYGGVGTGTFPRVGFDFAIDMPDDRIYSVVTPGGAANPAGSPFIVYNTAGIFPLHSIINGTGGTFSIDNGGRACPVMDTCFVSITGMLSGDGGSSAGITYQVWQSGYSTQSVYGAAAFTTSGASNPVTPEALDTPLADGNYAALVARASGTTVLYDRPATFGASGELATVETGVSQTVNIGSNAMSEMGGNDDVMWGRWTGGGTGGTGSYSGRDLSGDRGMHWAVGTPTADVPANGTAHYDLTASTAPVFNDGRSAPGTLSGGIVVAWNGASSRIGAELDVAMPGDATYHMATTGGLATPATSELVYTGGASAWRFSGNVPVTVTGSGAACDGPCTASVNAQPFGAGASTIGLGFEIGTSNAASSITGMGIFSPALP